MLLTVTMTCDLMPDLDEQEVTFEVDYYAGSPAQTWGPPESCDPGDPDEIRGWTATHDETQRELSQQDFRNWAKVEECLYEECRELASVSDDDYPDD